MTYGTSKITDQTSAGDKAIPVRLSCLLEGPSPEQRDHNRTRALIRLNLLGNAAIPIFDEATQSISRLLAMPICILSVVDAEMQRFKSVVGLSSLGLMNQLAATRRLPRSESFCTQVIDSGKVFALEDATAHPAFSRSLLVQQYGLQSYLGVPLVTTEGCCIGTLSVMDLLPHRFTPQEIALLELSARWSMSEFEKQQALTALAKVASPSHTAANALEKSLLSKISRVRSDLVIQLTQDLHNPLTSIAGMANMLSREIYGPLSEKQREYTKIVLSSSQQLLSIVDEIVEIGNLNEDSYQLVLTAVDIEMLIQQVLASLEEQASKQDLKLKHTVEPGSRIWNLDKRIVKQLIYHLVSSLAEMSTAGSTVRMHVSRKEDSINIAFWVSNPWLGEDLPQAIMAWEQGNFLTPLARPPAASKMTYVTADEGFADSALSNETADVCEAPATVKKADVSRQELGLLLSRHLTKMHGGETFVQGSAPTGYRYIISLPALESFK
ncbi:hypothetical protein BH23CYA1_BH23CYA1_12730 [soil metagenome]|uniref:GAF domain-containing sensor histidine kinase n=1 Tax=Leptolyngbya sp. BC1307 TaxID=2029589 RepID=UPI000EFBB8EE|nr:GAF domain-containing sensor histidine kinase [Leptolyngbya sp. BC1307]